MAIELLWIDEPDEYVIRRFPRHSALVRAWLSISMVASGAVAAIVFAVFSHGLFTFDSSAFVTGPFAVLVGWAFYVQLWSWAWALGGEERLVVTRQGTELTRRYRLRIFDRALRVPGSASIRADLSGETGTARVNAWRVARLGDRGMIVVETAERSFRFGMGADALAVVPIVEAVHRSIEDKRLARERAEETAGSR